jgi:hypothetical protein
MGVNKIYNVYKGLKKAFSKTDDTITGMKPTTGQKETRDFKMGAGIKRLNKQIDKLQELKKK